MKNNLVKNTLLLSIGNFATKGINFLMIPFFSSWLSTADYGTFDLLSTYVSLLIPFITLSSSDAIFRFGIDKSEISEKTKYITNGLLLNLFNTFLFSVVLIICYIYNDKFTIIPFLFLLISQIMMNYLQGFLRATKKLEIYSFASIISTVFIALFTTILLLKYHLGLTGIIIGYAIGYFVGSIFVIIWTKHWKYLSLSSFSIRNIKELVKYALPLIPNNVSWWIINVSDRTIINIFLGPVANGIYAIAYKVPNFSASIFNVFSISWQETATDLIDYKERHVYFNQVYNKTISIMISLCGGLLTLNYFLFHFVFDKRYFDALYISPILITSVIFVSLTQFFGGIQISLKRTKENGFTTLIGAIINLAICLGLIKFFGLYSAAIATLISNIVVTLIRQFRLTSNMKFKLDKINYIYIFIYIYLFAIIYISQNIIVNCIDIILAIILFVSANNEFLLKIKKRLIFLKV
ncbi:oligosaccharide flippase family protein [Pullulanibacillus sp. KACC 23026]|uniref:lipopolysaccharide biosynthesis protein n=1 Tax=Pullulanibacillus sp. KACC 23026 TaxID=3028315 RepID=UPI0023AF4688|nr:oligosaccharide flippase family protein [Pullulanibacillus sp. KACC 23026]WEG13393.1 oligosaccharide flippase family protein [Pullulanibacillus sp. KACC 23026]